MTLVAGFQYGGEQVLLADSLCTDPSSGTRYLGKGMKSVFAEQGGCVAAGDLAVVQRVLTRAYTILGASRPNMCRVIRNKIDCFVLARQLVEDCVLVESTACETIWRLPTSDGAGIVFGTDQAGAVVFDDLLLVAGNVGPHMAGAVRALALENEALTPSQLLVHAAHAAVSACDGASAPFEYRAW